MTARWLDRPPTADEVRAHAAAHPYQLSPRTVGCLWLLSASPERGEKPMIIALDAQGEAYAARLHANPRGARWLPLTADGLPVCLPTLPCGHTIDRIAWEPGRIAKCSACAEDPEPDPGEEIDGWERGRRELARDLPSMAERCARRELEQRLCAAWRASGLPLGHLVSWVLLKYADSFQQRVCYRDVTDVQVVEWVERYVARGAGAMSQSFDEAWATPTEVPSRLAELETKARLWDVVQAWVRQHKPSCPEDVYQQDSVNLAAPDLVIAVCNVVGWHQVDRDDEEEQGR